MLRAALQSNLDNEFGALTAFWSPRVVAVANGQHVKVAKVKGEFVWHAHADEDEFFLVRKGTLTIRYRDRRMSFWARAISMWFPRASSTCLSLQRNAGSCSSSRPQRSTPGRRFLP